jgi:hypothetical protein
MCHILSSKRTNYCQFPRMDHNIMKMEDVSDQLLHMNRFHRSHLLSCVSCGDMSGYHANTSATLAALMFPRRLYQLPARTSYYRYHYHIVLTSHWWELSVIWVIRKCFTKIQTTRRTIVFCSVSVTFSLGWHQYLAGWRIKLNFNKP